MDNKTAVSREDQKSQEGFAEERNQMDCHEPSSAKELARQKSDLVKEWHEICDGGDYPVLFSFLTVSKDRENFGVLTLPGDFFKKFGATLPFMVGLRCENILWCVNYDLESNEIYGLERLMKFYGLKILNMVQLDYYGRGVFKIRIFKDTALECKYPLGRGNDVECSTEWEDMNRAKYVLDTGTLEFEKSMSSVSFNAISNRTDYASMLFVAADVDHSRGTLMLSPSWETFYEHWNNGDLVSFKLLNASWSIKIKRRGEVCYLGKGLFDFVAAVGLRDGDYLVAFKDDEKEHYCLSVCIYAAEDHGLDLLSAEPVTKGWSKSFFKLMNQTACEGGFCVVPFLVNEFYGWKLRGIQNISLGGLEWGLCYNSFPGYVYNLQEMFVRFGLKENETIIFTLNDTKVLYGRIYQSNGVEINYPARLRHESADSAGDWIWSLEEKTKMGDSNQDDADEAMETDEDPVNVKEFSTYLSAGNVDKKTHGVFIPSAIKPATGNWKRRQTIRFRTDKGVWDLGITLTGSRPRLSAGWNRFIRENEYEAGQGLNFRMVEDSDFVEFAVRKI